MCFSQVDFHVKQPAEKGQAVQQLLDVVAGPSQQVDVIGVHHVWDAKVADDGPGARHSSQDQLMQ
jgi:hypothetical protein